MFDTHPWSWGYVHPSQSLVRHWDGAEVRTRSTHTTPRRIAEIATKHTDIKQRWEGRDVCVNERYVRTCLRVQIHGQSMLPSLMRSFVGQSSIREHCPPASHELTVELSLLVCYNRTQTHTHTQAPCGARFFNRAQEIAQKKWTVKRAQQFPTVEFESVCE